MAGNLTTVERFERLAEVKKMQEEGHTEYEIAQSTGMSLNAVKRNIKALERLGPTGLTTEDIALKREKLDTELTLAAKLAKELFDRYSKEGKDSKPVHARAFHQRWTESLLAIAKLYGLDGVKMSDNYTQINTGGGPAYVAPTTDLNKDQLDKIADVIVGRSD